MEGKAWHGNKQKGKEEGQGKVGCSAGSVYGIECAVFSLCNLYIFPSGSGRDLFRCRGFLLVKMTNQ